MQQTLISSILKGLSRFGSLYSLPNLSIWGLKRYLLHIYFILMKRHSDALIKKVQSSDKINTKDLAHLWQIGAFLHHLGNFLIFSKEQNLHNTFYLVG